MKNLFLIDANSLIHRAFHALPPLTGPGGEPTNALYGLASILIKIWRDEQPDYAAALFDRPEPTLREQEFKEYKAQRPPTPETLSPQLKEAHNLFCAFGIATLDAPGYEADDLIATLAEKFRRTPDLKISILTGDMDTLQLIAEDNLVVRILQKGVSDTKTYDAAAVKERYGVAPERLIDYKAFVGDASDNIKGVPGIGPKTAVNLVNRFGSLEKILEAAADDPVLQNKLGPFREQAIQSKRLVTLDRYVATNLNQLDDFKLDVHLETVRQYLAKFGFNTLVKRLDNSMADAKPKSIRANSAQGKIF